MKKIFFISIAIFQFSIAKAEVISHDNSYQISDTNIIIVDTNQTLTIYSNTIVSGIRVYLGGKLIINPGVTVTVIEETNGNDELHLYPTAEISGGGILKTSCVIDHDIIFRIWETGVFNVDFESSSGRAVFLNGGSENTLIIHKRITIDNGAKLMYAGSNGLSTLYALDNIINNGKLLTGTGFIVFKGQSITNNDTISADLKIDTNCSITGSGIWRNTYTFVNSFRTLTLMDNVKMSSRNFIIETNGILDLNSFTLTLDQNSAYSIYLAFILNSSSAVLNGGLIKTLGSVQLYFNYGSNFNTPLRIASGNAATYFLFTAYNAIFNKSITIDSGATFSDNGYDVTAKNDIINYGTINSGGHFIFKGSLLSNFGNAYFGQIDFDSSCSIQGNGIWSGGYYKIKNNKSLTLLSDVTLKNSNFILDNYSILNPNSYALTYNTQSLFFGNFFVDSTANINNSGMIITQGTVNLTNRYKSNFNSPLRVNKGQTNVSENTVFQTSVFNNITIDSGSILNCANKVFANGNVSNNGTISGNEFRLFGQNFSNNGNINLSNFYFESGTLMNSSEQTLTGTGYFSDPTLCNFSNGSNVTLNSDHQFSKLIINAGGSFDITNKLIKISGGLGYNNSPIINNGTFTTTGSNIEYNGTNNYQTIATANIIYNSMKINNPNGAYMFGNITIPSLLIIQSGNLVLNGNIITLDSSAAMSETPNNTVSGTSGFIITTRYINAQTELNVGGMGAVISTSQNLGTTVIKRGHSNQFGIVGHQSVSRYFDITPSNNSNLNATLGFKYDDSELGTIQESQLGLFKSTNGGLNYVFEGGTIDTLNNQITVSGINDFSRWSAGRRQEAIAANITLAIEGLLDVNTLRLNSRDTVTSYLANSMSPYNFVDSAKSIIDTVNYTGSFLFANAPSGIYYIAIKHRNSLETWSKSGGEEYKVGINLNYNFTTSLAQAYGNNLKLISGLACIYSGDVNNDGTIDIGDLGLIDNDSYNFIVGYANTDVNGDGFVDLIDLAIADNNGLNFVSVVKP